MIKKTIMIAFTIVVFSIASKAQTTVPKDTIEARKAIVLKGLKKAEDGDIPKGTQMALNPSVTPVYYDDFSLMNGGDLITVILSGIYTPEPYIDSNKAVKIFVLRKLTEQEKAEAKLKKAANPVKNTPTVQKASAFNVTDIKGKEYAFEELKGKVIVVNFWFAACKPCVAEMPELNKLVEKYKGKDVVFLAISTDKKQVTENFLKTTPYKYNIVAFGRDVANLYKVRSYPTHLVIDKNSNVSYLESGLSANTVSELDSKIESLLK